MVQILLYIKMSSVFSLTEPQKNFDLTLSGHVFLSQPTCRSTSARHAANPFHKERHPNAQGKTQNLILLIRLLTNYL